MTDTAIAWSHPSPISYYLKEAGIVITEWSASCETVLLRWRGYVDAAIVSRSGYLVYDSYENQSLFQIRLWV